MKKVLSVILMIAVVLTSFSIIEKSDFEHLRFMLKLFSSGFIWWKSITYSRLSPHLQQGVFKESTFSL